MTQIVPRIEKAAPARAMTYAAEAAGYLSMGLDLARQPDRTAFVVLDLGIGRKADAMRKAMNQIARESADRNIRDAVSELQFRCNNRVLARLFDIAAVHADTAGKGA